MVNLPPIDNKWLAAASKSGAGKALSGAKSLVAPKSEKEKSPTNDVSAESLNNNSDLGTKNPVGRNDFQSTLKNKIDSPSQVNSSKEDPAIESRDVSDDAEPVALADSDSVVPNKSVSAAAPKVISKVMSASAAPEAQPMEHRIAWNSFLHKMKEKLGVSAKDILAAFKSLTKEELKAPPEQNIAKLVGQLGLNDSQAAMARQFFKELIVRTDAQPLNQDARLAADGGPLAMMSQQEIHEQKQAQSLQQMNRNFFMKGEPVQAGQVQAAETQAAQAPMQKAQVTDDKQDDLTAPIASASLGGMEIPKELANASSDSVPQAQVDNMTKAAAKPMTEAKTETKASSHAVKAAAIPAWQQAAEIPAASSTSQASAASLVNVPKAMAKNVSGPASNFDPNQSVVTAPTQTNVAPIPVVPMAPAFGGAPEKNHDDSSDDTANNIMMDGDETAMAGHGFSVNGHNDVQAGQDMKKAMPTMAIPDLIQQAHVMVKDGGGEMKVVLTPEGLGEVAMKVTVKDGKVNVEMITQSDEAKKIIQDSFHALRDGLNAHHLNLDSIKVDTASNLGTQLEQQYKDAQRGQAQQFLEQFHQDNRGWRNSYFDIPGAEAYRSQTQRAPVGPQTNKQSSSARRLDLVA